MKSPCEVIVSKILPSIKALLVKTLVKRGIRQKEVATMLGITQASVSQYLAAVRGGDKKLLAIFPEMETYAEDMAEKIVGSGKKETYIALLCEICKKIRSDKKFYEYYKQLAPLEECGICYKK